MKHAQSTRNPVETAQKLTDSGLNRETADVIAEAIHDVSTELSRKIHDSHTDLSNKIDKAKSQFIGWMLTGMTLNLAAVGILITALKLFGSGEN